MCESRETGGFREQLLRSGLFVATGVKGLYGLSGAFEHVLEAFDRHVVRAVAEGRAGATPEVIRFPPVMSRADYVRTDHLDSFPDLIGSVHAFAGDERQHQALLQERDRGADWSRALCASAVMLAPAVCYPLYGTASGRLPPGGRTVDLRGFVFRHEPSDDPARLQSFRMHEFVRMGTPEEALAHRDGWLDLGEALLREAGLEPARVPANDPFFGRGGKVMAASQREQALKYELVVPIASDERPTAVMSSNCHLDHFAATFGIRTHAEAVAHTACIGFGLERTTLALFRRHGLDAARWPYSVRSRLEL